MGEHLDGDIIEECARSVKRKVAVVICFSSAIVEKLEDQPFVISKLYQLRALGASIYDVSDFEQANGFICQRDFETTLEIDPGASGRPAYLDKGEKHLQCLSKIISQYSP